MGRHSKGGIERLARDAQRLKDLIARFVRTKLLSVLMPERASSGESRDNCDGRCS